MIVNFPATTKYSTSSVKYPYAEVNKVLGSLTLAQMGLFMDGDGIPLAFCINNVNNNKQVTLKPLEEKIISDFKLLKFVVCTDAGLASTANRKFNDAKTVLL